jgi:HSP20 family protein
MAKEKQHKETRTQEDKTRTTQEQTALSTRRQSMPAVFANPFSFMRRFGEGMEQLFEDFGFGALTHRGFDQFSVWSPQIEMFHQEGQLHIRADLPGLNKDNVQVELQDDSIIIRGERREENKEEREGFYRSERSYGSFYREIPLPRGVDTSKATANFNDGVLEITMPAKEDEGRGRRLEIKGTVSGEQTKPRAQAAGTGR